MKSNVMLAEHWAESISVILVLIGFLISLFLNSALLSYFVIVLAGFLAGRFIFERRTAQPIFPFILIIIGFLLGFMLGAIWANKFLIIILFLASAIASYQLHKRGYLEYFKTAGFIR